MSISSCQRKSTARETKPLLSIDSSSRRRAKFGQIFKSDFRSRIKVYINFKVNCSNVFENYSSQDETRVISIFICNFTCIRPFFLFAPLPLYFRSPPLFSFLALFLSSRQPTTHTHTHTQARKEVGVRVVVFEGAFLQTDASIRSALFFLCFSWLEKTKDFDFVE